VVKEKNSNMHLYVRVVRCGGGGNPSGDVYNIMKEKEKENHALPLILPSKVKKEKNEPIVCSLSMMMMLDKIHVLSKY